MKSSSIALLAFTLLASHPLRAQESAAPPELAITVSTLAGQMKYDLKAFEARPGQVVALTLKNNDEMPHNLVLLKPDATDLNGAAFSQKAWELAGKGPELNWTPPGHPRVLAAVKLIDPKASETVRFTTPTVEGDYPFVCTLPGHALIMNGVMHVRQDRPALTGLKFRVFDIAKESDALPTFAALEPKLSGDLPEGKVDVKTTAQMKELKGPFAVRFEGNLEVREDGEYTFSAASAEGTRVTVGGKVVVNHDKKHGSGPIKDGKIKLKKGTQTFLVDYFHTGAGRDLYVAWAGPGFQRSALSTWVHPKHGEGGTNADSETTGLPLVPANGEAVIYRNFIEGASARGIAIGYPGGVSQLFDANLCNVAEMWVGAFVDAKRHWTGRGVGFQPPAGFGRAKIGPDAPLAALANADAPWPAHEDRPAGFTFMGYRVDKKQFPTFRYRFNDVVVEDRCEPSGDVNKSGVSLARRISLKAGKPVDSLYFRVAAGNIAAADGKYVVDGHATITLPAGVKAVFREAGKGRELLLPVTFANGAATLEWSHSWLSQSGHATH